MRHPYESFAKLQEHYQLEKNLAEKLKSAAREERQTLYSSLYDEMFEKIPFHPQIKRKRSVSDSMREVNRKMNLVERFLKPDISFVEIGPGDCNFSIAVCPKVSSVKALDVSKTITHQEDLPKNFELVLFDGCSIPLDDESIDLVYSNQLLEHLHPEDADIQLRDVLRILRPGGLYICITPNRLSGPHDVSQYFDPIATGFHLKEYSYTELKSSFEKAGFSQIRFYVGGRGIYLRFPIYLIEGIEFILEVLPLPMRQFLGRSLPGRFLLGAVVVGEK